MQKALEQFKFALLMWNLRKTITLFLTVAFFYSAVGHAFVLHYCNASDNIYMETSCCSEGEKPACSNDVQIESEDCCIISSQYLVNPFSVRQPAGFEIKNPDLVSASVELFAVESPVTFTKSSQKVLKDFIPPDKDFLSRYHILLI